SRQIQELLTILAKKKLLKASYLHSLVHCGMTALDLSPCNYLVSDSVIQMITRRCQEQALQLKVYSCCYKTTHIYRV
ncbi:hypothetical protein QZH41_009056, partial [Actinostola sp. cb2023]